MATNTLLTIDDITREALRVLSEKLTFIKNIDRQYDSSFAVGGAKIGDTLRIRKPAKFAIRNGATLVPQDYTEEKTTLKIENQTGVDVTFTSAELTLSMDDFSARIIEPAMTRIAAEIESQVIAKAVIGTGGAVAGASFKDFLTAGAYLDNNNAPLAGRGAFAAPLTQVELIDALKTLQNDTKQISQQYVEGKLGMAAGYTWYSNNKLPTITYPATDLAGAMAVTLTSANLNTTSLSTSAFTSGDVIAKGTPVTVAGVYAVNNETGATLPYLKQWTTTTDVTVTTAGLATLVLAEGIRASGVDKNCSAYPVGAAVVSVIGASAAGLVKQVNIACAPQFMTFATADLNLPGGVDMASRQNYDGLSLRLVRQYDIGSDTMPCRIDILWGASVMQPSQGISVIG